MRKFMVIGSNSFSGSDFVDLLLNDSANQVVGLSRSGEKHNLFLPYKKNRNLSNFKFYQLDLNKDTLKIVELADQFKPDYIINFSAQSEVLPSWKNPTHWFETNVVAMANLADGLKEKKYLKKYVHISSPEVYGNCVGNVTESTPVNPSTPYAASKAGGDLALLPYIKNFGFPVVSIRATNVYGAHQQLFKIIPRSYIYIKSGKTIELHGGGVAVKSFIHVRDVSKGELAAALEGTPGEMYHLSPDNSGYEVRDIVKRICKIMEVPFEKATKAVGERLGQDAAYVIDSTKARTKLGWKPEIGIDEGLAQIKLWVNDNWADIQKQTLEYVHKQ